MSRSLALDVGDKRIGVALSDPDGILASPYTIINRKGDDTDITAIVNIIDQQQVGHIIVGIPHSLDGSIGHQAEKVQAFIAVLLQQVKVPLLLRDERLTTVSAQKLYREANTKRNKQKVEYDSFAAAVILQSYLDEAAFQRETRQDDSSGS